MEVVALAKIISTIVQPVAKEIFKKAKSHLKPTEFEQALQAGIIAAHKEEENLASQQGLFYLAGGDGLDGFTKFLSHFFLQEAVQKELLKPINNQGKPDVDFIVSALEQAAEKSQLELQLERIEPWLRQFVETYFAKTSTYLKYQVAKEKYFRQLLNRYDQIQFAGIPVAGQEEEKVNQLAEIFVMPDVQEKSSRSFDFTDIENNSGQQRQRKLDSSGRKFLPQELLQRNQAKKFVLLGAPGSGKTTLMSYFAVMLADKKSAKLGLDENVDWLPIILRIRDLSRQPEDISILDYAKLYAEKNLAVKDLPVGFFEHWLENGQAIILLDGLDEIPEEAKRYQIVGRIESFLTRFGENRAIITSRPAGYKQDFFRTGEFPHFQLQSFDDEKIEEFINLWYDSRFADKGERERRKESLRKALNENERIKLLGRNPLLLTIIALIHRYYALLPKERHKLYDKAVETLLTSWDAKKELSSHKKLQCLQLDDLRRLMAIIAFWIHTQDTAGDGEGGTLIDRDELLEKLSREIKNLKQVELYQAQAEAERFIELIQQRTGLLNEQGQDCYGFVHKTFQEYLCAEEIDYQANDEGDFDIILQQISDRLHDPHWREVLLLLIAQQTKKKAAKAIRAVLNNGSEYEQWLHRDLLFAGDCLAENPKYLQAADRDLPQEILQKLVELEVKDNNLVGERIRKEIFRILCSFAETEFESQALEILKEKEETINRWRLYDYRAALEEKEQVIEELLNLLADKDKNVRGSAARALGKLGKRNEQVIKALLNLLTDEDDYVRRNVALALGNLGEGNGEVIQALLNALTDDNNGHVRENAAEALAKLGGGNQQLIHSLFDLLGHENLDVSSQAAWALGHWTKDNEQVIKALLNSLKDEHEYVRRNATWALVNSGVNNEQVIKALFNSLKDEHEYVRDGAARALGEIGKNDKEITAVVIKWLKQRQDSEYIGDGIDALWDLTSSNK